MINTAKQGKLRTAFGFHCRKARSQRRTLMLLQLLVTLFKNWCESFMFVTRHRHSKEELIKYVNGTKDVLRTPSGLETRWPNFGFSKKTKMKKPPSLQCSLAKKSRFIKQEVILLQLPMIYFGHSRSGIGSVCYTPPSPA